MTVRASLPIPSTACGGSEAPTCQKNEARIFATPHRRGFAPSQLACSRQRTNPMKGCFLCTGFAPQDVRGSQLEPASRHASFQNFQSKQAELCVCPLANGSASMNPPAAKKRTNASPRWSSWKMGEFHLRHTRHSRWSKTLLPQTSSKDTRRHWGVTGCASWNVCRKSWSVGRNR